MLTDWTSNVLLQVREYVHLHDVIYKVIGKLLHISITDTHTNLLVSKSSNITWK